MSIRPTRVALAALVAFAAACSESTPTAVTDTADGRFDNPGVAMRPAAAEPSIADIAIAASMDADAPQFTILVAALQAAGLVDALDGKGQFTVFAPTDAAFGDLLTLLDTTAEDLLANTELLTQVLLYHVATGSRFSGDVLASEQIRTLNGAFIFPAVSDDGAFIIDGNAATADAQLLAPGLIDIAASNGVIHVIDQVLLPAF